MLVANDPVLMDRVNFLRDHGRTPGDFSFENSEVAYKYKMSALQAALGLAQLERIDEIIARKREAFGWYRDRLSDMPGVRLNDPGLNVESAFWMVSLVWDDRYRGTKKDLRDALAIHGIDTRPFFSPLSSLAAFRHLPGIEACRERNPVSYRLRDKGINLPSSLSLVESEADVVCHQVRAFFARHA